MNRHWNRASSFATLSDRSSALSLSLSSSLPTSLTRFLQSIATHHHGFSSRVFFLNSTRDFVGPLLQLLSLSGIGSDRE